MRIGIGYDIHRLVQGRPLILGGVPIAHEKGLLGHSDADVLVHAICDALLGAAGLGDIGLHFPDTDPQYKDISSLTLLEAVRDKLSVQGWQVVNIDATVVAEEPKLSGFIEQMRQQLSQTLGIASSQVSVKASTSARLGAIGRGEGIAVYAVAIVQGSKDEGI